MRTTIMLTDIDLSDAEVRAAQSANASTFRKRQLRVLLGFISAFVPFLLSGHIAEEHEGYAVAFVFVSLLFCLFSLFLYKCPNCGSQPQGTSVSLGGEVSYTRGVHPFPKRCGKCGFYLSRRALEKAHAHI